MPRFVVLRHDCPDGSWHYDWMIEYPGDPPDPGRPLITFRLDVLPGTKPRFEAERISDHRVEYLEYEGSISDNRGSVKRVARGEAQLAFQGVDRLEVRLVEGVRYIGTRHEAHWVFESV